MIQVENKARKTPTICMERAELCIRVALSRFRCDNENASHLKNPVRFGSPMHFRSLLIRCFMVAIAFSIASESLVNAQFSSRSSTRGKIGSRQSGTQSVNRSLELKVLADPRGAIGSQQEWMQMLAEVGADRVVSSTSKATKPSFEEFGSGNNKTLSITGILKNGKLLLPGGSFSIRQSSAIKAHLQKLRDDGAEVTVAEKVAFGLTAIQMIEVLERMSTKIDSPTQGKKTAATIRSLLSQSGYPIDIEKTARETLSGLDSDFKAELKGLTAGTGLAIALREAGLVYEPHRPQGKDVRLLVRTVDDKKKNWPIGWPIEESIRKVAPKLYVKIDLSVNDTLILKILNGIEGRLELPFIYDFHKMELKGVDLDATKVTFVKNRVPYITALEKVLSQTKPRLKPLLLADEEGKIFVWITPRN